jgi:hypothetical protein
MEKGAGKVGKWEVTVINIHYIHVWNHNETIILYK